MNVRPRFSQLSSVKEVAGQHVAYSGMGDGNEQCAKGAKRKQHLLHALVGVLWCYLSMLGIGYAQTSAETPSSEQVLTATSSAVELLETLSDNILSLQELLVRTEEEQQQLLARQATLERQMSGLSTENQQLKTEIEVRDANIADRDAVILRVEQEQALLKEAQTDLTEQNEMLTAELARVQASEETLKAQVETLTASLAEREEGLSAQKSLTEETQAQISELVGTLGSSQAENDRLQTQVDEADRQITQLDRAVRVLEQERDTLKQWRDKFMDTFTSLQDELTNEMISTQEERDNFQVQAQQLEAELASLTASHETLKGEMSLCLADEGLTEQEAELASLREERLLLEQTITDALDENDALKKERDIVQGDVASLRDQVLQLRDLLEVAQTENTQLKEQLQGVQNERGMLPDRDTDLSQVITPPTPVQVTATDVSAITVAAFSPSASSLTRNRGGQMAGGLSDATGESRVNVSGREMVEAAAVPEEAVSRDSIAEVAEARARSLRLMNAIATIQTSINEQIQQEGHAEGDSITDLEVTREEFERAQGEVAQVLGALGTHKVSDGDTLSDISNRYYGTSARWPDILEINSFLVNDPNEIKPGFVLILPE